MPDPRATHAAPSGAALQILLLAAGAGSRFRQAGGTDKLLAPWAGTTVAEASAQLLAGMGTVHAVVRAHGALSQRLAALGCRVLIAPSAERGLGASIAAGVSALSDQGPILVALADMPAVRPSSVEALIAAVRAGAEIAVPVHDGQRGHPVVFAAHCHEALCALDGDQGARRLFDVYPVTRVEVDDPGVLFDVDVPAHLDNTAVRHG